MSTYGKEYKHHWTEVLKVGLKALWDAEEPMKLSKLGLEFSVRTNFQKLQYFGLVRKLGHGNLWAITDLGIKFVKGEVQIPSWVSTVDSCFLNESTEKISFKDEARGSQSPAQFVKESQYVKIS